MKKVMLPIMLLVAASRLPAQTPQPHGGFWIGFGVGIGVNTGTGFESEKLAGGTGYLRLGGTPRQGLLLGWEGHVWVNDDNSRGNGVFLAQLYPSRQGFFLKGGVGIAHVDRTTTAGSTTTTTSKNGFGLLLGTGIDLKIGRNIYLVPGFDILLQGFKEETDPVLGNIPGGNSIVSFTLGLTWH